MNTSTNRKGTKGEKGEKGADAEKPTAAPQESAEPKPETSAETKPSEERKPTKEEIEALRVDFEKACENEAAYLAARKARSEAGAKLARALLTNPKNKGKTIEAGGERWQIGKVNNEPQMRRMIEREAAEI